MSDPAERRPPTSPGGLQSLGVPILLYAVLWLLSFYPQSVRPQDAVPVIGDAVESVYIVSWNVHQFFRDPLHLFDANVLYPQPHALALTDHRLLPSLVVAPVVWLTGNPVLAYNIAVALACGLAAIGARSLALALGCGPIGAWAAGALYGFHTYQISEAPRLNIIFHGFVPLALAHLLWFLRDARRRDAWLAVIYVVLEGWSSAYHLLYTCYLLSAVALVFFVARPQEVVTRLARLSRPAVLGGLLLLPLTIPYWVASREMGFRRDLPEGIDVGNYLATLPTNFMYPGGLKPPGVVVNAQQKGPHFVGIAALGLAGLAVLSCLLVRADPLSGDGLLPSRLWVPVAAIFAVTLATLSLGRDVMVFGHNWGPGPYRLLYGWAPGFGHVRIPERLSLLAMLFVALLVAQGLTLVGRACPGRPALRWTLVVALAALVPLEHVSPRCPPFGSLPVTLPVGGAMPPVYRWLAQAPVHAMAEVPVRGEGLIGRETLDMYFSTAHFKPITSGYSAYSTLLNRLLRRLAAEFPAPVSLQALSLVGVDTVLVHLGRPSAELWPDLYNTVRPGRGADAEVAKLLVKTEMNIYDRLPLATAAGEVVLEAQFPETPGNLLGATGDEVYRIGKPGPTIEVAPMPAGPRLPNQGWQCRTKDPKDHGHDPIYPHPCGSWMVSGPLKGDEYLQVVFDRVHDVGGVLLPLRWDSTFPTRFRIAGLSSGSRDWTELARFDDAHALQLLIGLLRDTKSAGLGFAFPSRPLLGVRLLIEEGGTGFDGWSLPPIEIVGLEGSS